MGWECYGFAIGYSSQPYTVLHSTSRVQTVQYNYSVGVKLPKQTTDIPYFLAKCKNN